MEAGIYQITNTVTGFKYVGMSVDIPRRYMEHKTPKNISKDNPLYNDVRRYGLEKFSFEVIEKVSDISRLPEREIYWIAKLKPEYNRNNGGRGNNGYKPSIETKSKLRDAGKKQWENNHEHVKQKIIKNNLKGPKIGHEVSSETRKKLSENLKGKKHTIEARMKISASNKIKAIGNKNGNKKVVAVFNSQETIYESLQEASKQTGVSKWGVTRVAKGRALSSKGYIFKYLK